MASTGLNAAGTGDPLQRMHVTRPKSAKGRSRSTPQGFPHTYPSCTSPPPRASSSVRASPRIAQDDVPELLNQLPLRPPSSSLNRYRVLPSIGATAGADCTEAQLVNQTNSMTLATEVPRRPARTIYGDQPIPTDPSGRETRTRQRPVPPDPREAPDQEPRLLLAIRCHSGERFQEYFRPSDTLHTVIAVAEARVGSTSMHCRVETMEVPRRSFPDLRQTLQECGIPNKSVLCIHPVERD